MNPDAVACLMHQMESICLRADRTLRQICEVKIMMNLNAATQEAPRLIGEMEPHCHRIDIAGSIRREVPAVKDIELVAIPRWEELPDLSDLFGSTVQVNQLHRWAMTTDAVRWIKPGTSAIEDWEPNPDGKYWRGLLPSGLKLDLFLANADNWGYIQLIRTGSAEFSQAVVTHALRVGYKGKGGYLTRCGEKIPTPTEESVFRELGLRWVDPRDRTGADAVKLL